MVFPKARWGSQKIHYKMALEGNVWVQIKRQQILHWLQCTYTNKPSQIDLKSPFFFFLEKCKLANTEAINKTINKPNLILMKYTTEKTY